MNLPRHINQNFFTKEPRRKQILVFFVVLFSCVSIILGEIGFLNVLAKRNEQKAMKEQKEYFRSLPIGKEPTQFRKFLKTHPAYEKKMKQINKDAKCYPIPIADWNKITYGDSWGGERTFGGNRIHEGCDLMANENIRGKIPIVSMSDGVVENKGWLTLGGWRIGIRADHGTYFYYAHLYSYAEGIKVGDRVNAGQLLGFMGDSGYGEEGMTGQFDVHLHVGIYLTENDGGEISVNPYWILQSLQQAKIGFKH